MTDGVVIRRLGAADASLLEQSDPELFDAPIDPGLTRDFLADARHHMFVAEVAGGIIGFVSGVHYIHPDKPAQMFINEVATVSAHRRRGIARALLDALCDHARTLGCSEAWVLTDRGNHAARSLYSAGGQEGDAALMFTFALD